MRFFLNKKGQPTKRWYWKPVWLNCISWEKNDPKVYKWLFFGWVI